MAEDTENSSTSYTSSGAFVVTMEGVIEKGEQFYSVEGLGIQYSTEPVVYGGIHYAYNVPKTYITSPLILKRAVTGAKSSLLTWCCEALNTGKFTPATLGVFVLDKSDNIINQWNVTGVIPVSFYVTAFDTEQKDGILREVFTLMYQGLTREK